MEEDLYKSSYQRSVELVDKINKLIDEETFFVVLDALCIFFEGRASLAKYISASEGEK